MEFPRFSCRVIVDFCLLTTWLHIAKSICDLCILITTDQHVCKETAADLGRGHAPAAPLAPPVHLLAYYHILELEFFFEGRSQELY
jgi:hypothetical protein